MKTTIQNNEAIENETPTTFKEIKKELYLLTAYSFGFAAICGWLTSAHPLAIAAILMVFGIRKAFQDLPTE